MQAVLLAAGMATRLRPLTNACPKCLLPVNGRSILDRALDVLGGAGLRDVVIVTGFHEEMIRAAVARRTDGVRVEWISNARYAETNNAYSLREAEPAVHGAFLLVDSDILFPLELVRALQECPHRPCLALDRHPCGPEEIKVLVDPDGFLTDIGKDVAPERAAGESIGVEIFSAEARDELFDTLRRRVGDQGRENEFYEASFREMIGRGTRFLAVDTSRFPAMEIDSAEDLERAGLAFGRVPPVSSGPAPRRS